MKYGQPFNLISSTYCKDENKTYIDCTSEIRL